MEFSTKKLLAIFLSIRVLMAVYSKSYHHGDETEQSVEIAHRIVFGQGHLTWEWTNPTPIRSVLHALMLFYKKRLKI